MLKQFVTSFITLFCLTTFVVGTVAYVLLPGQITSPIPEGSMMLRIGLVTAVIAIVNLLRRAHAT